MASSPTPPSYVPTLTEVVRRPERDATQSPDPDWVTQQVLQRLMPQLEAMVRQKVRHVLVDLEKHPQRSQD